MAPMAISTPLAFRASPTRLLSRRRSGAKSGVALPGLQFVPPGISSRLDERIHCHSSLRKNTIVASENENPPLMPAIMTPAGALDLATVLLGNRIIFIGQYINSQVAQRVISQLVTLAAVDEEADILIKPKVGTVCFGVVASQAAIILAGGEKGMRYAMPNARVMIHQPQGGSEGNVEEVRRQVGETIYARDKVDKMFAAFTGQTLDMVQQWTERDRFMSSSEAMDFGLVDALLETRY
uniref:ATP-dependent Clp protease proteolytic subunit n=1 Tax=Oryza glaberrima TaxID=4538 RepID=I1PC80_ORYGL